MTHLVILVEIDVLKLDAAPKAFAEDVVTAAAVQDDLNVGSELSRGDVINCKVAKSEGNDKVRA